jgi:hypothetical protein
MSIRVDYFRVGGPSQTAGGRRRKLLTAKVAKKILKRRGRGERLGGGGERLFAAKIIRVALRPRGKS